MKYTAHLSLPLAFALLVSPAAWAEASGKSATSPSLEAPRPAPVRPGPGAPAAGEASGPEAPLASSRALVNSDSPPPSSYDLARRRGGEAVPEEGRSLVSQALRTIFALLLVVALIYLFGKLVLTRMGRVKSVGGPRLRITDRLQIDGRNALLIVEVDGRRLLVGASGDKGMSLLSALESGSGKAFAETLTRVAASDGAQGSAASAGAGAHEGESGSGNSP